MSLKNLGASNLPREKALLYGIKSLSDAELIAILIQCGTHDDNALVLSNKIIEKANGIEGLTNLSVYDLCELKGIKRAKALKIMASIELGKRAELNHLLFKEITSPKEVYECYGKLIKDSPVEKFILLALDSHKRVIHYEIYTNDLVDKTRLSVQNILKVLLNYGATYAYFIHNHPSNRALPSDGDLSETNLLNIELKTLGITLLDHLIVTKDSFYSFLNNDKLKFKINLKPNDYKHA